jgi:hypothetical protein
MRKVNGSRVSANSGTKAANESPLLAIITKPTESAPRVTGMAPTSAEPSR